MKDESGTWEDTSGSRLGLVLGQRRPTSSDAADSSDLALSIRESGAGILGRSVILPGLLSVLIRGW